jgi:triosephosphate isomerase/glyceraldehyde-3-phosphate dehydrogenase/erythrose-4-phosphate dehydrogenase
MVGQERFQLIGNVKTYKYRLADAKADADVLFRRVADDCFRRVNIVYAPPVPLLGCVATMRQSYPTTDAELGSQSISWRRHGMDTGGLPGDSLADIGVRLAIVNHSEQKLQLQCHPDYYQHCRLQVTNAVESGLNVVFCCGEERGDKRHSPVEQLRADLLGTFKLISKNYHSAISRKCLIAYEPGGVVGTGKAAPIAQIRTVFDFIRQIFQELELDCPRLLYGGGVNLENLPELHFGLRSESSFAGYLVGEASARIDEFIEMASWLNTDSISDQPDFIGEETCPQNEATPHQLCSEIVPQGRTRVAIVGFGEIGSTTAIVSAKRWSESIEVAQIFNKHLPPEDACARVMYSRYLDPEDVSSVKQNGSAHLRILDQFPKITPHDSMEEAAAKLDDIDVVIFTIGEFTKDPAFVRPFLQEGRAKATIVTCETAAADFHMVPGFNHHLVNVGQHRIIALGSCTGNCAVPILSLIENEFGDGAIRGLYALAPHSKTNTQEIGNKGADPKKEGLLGNLIPTTTGLSKLLQYPGFFQMMNDSMEAISVRTPTEDVSLLGMLVDVETEKYMTTGELRKRLRDAANVPRWRGIVGFDQARGTRVFWKDSHACVIYEPHIRFLPKFLRNGSPAPIASISVLAAYANVYGYSCQVARGILALNLGRKIKSVSGVTAEDNLVEVEGD